MQDMFYAMTETEIARELGISKTAVKTILHRALEKIRKHPELCARFRDGKTGEVTLARIGGVVLPPSNYPSPIARRETITSVRFTQVKGKAREFG